MDSSQESDDVAVEAPETREVIDTSIEHISLNCRVMRIGSYKFEPTEYVIFTAKGIRLSAPAVDNSSEQVVLYIQHREIVKILLHVGSIAPVLFIYTLPSCAYYVRQKLGMSHFNNGTYFDCCASEEIYKRIAILSHGFTDNFPEFMYKFYGKPQTILDELSARETNEILSKICKRELELQSEIRQILIYPPGKGGISINTEDYGSLEQDKYLNDVIIDFYLKYLCNEVLSDDTREKTHVFSTFFYTRLTSRVDYSSFDSDFSSAQQRYARVKNWTKNVNIFEKDYIIIPINENLHWYLAIICFPGLNIRRRCFKKLTDNEEDPSPTSSQSSVESEEEDDSESRMMKQPCILIFDSLSGNSSSSRSRTISVLRDYLTCELQTKFDTDESFDRFSLKGHNVRVPQQDNLTDCGLYVLQFVEQFFRVPIMDYSIPIQGLENWFETIAVTKKREDISNLIKKLVTKYNADNLPLPDITFPTHYGTLVDQEIIETADEFKDHIEDGQEQLDDEDYCNDSEYNDDEDSEPNQEGALNAARLRLKRERRSDTESECESPMMSRRRLRLNENDG